MNRIPPSQPGDIIFLSPGAKSANTKAQSIVRRRDAIHSHVAVAVGHGNAIHAMPHDGVHATTIRSLLSEPRIEFSVFRNKSLSLNNNLLEKLEEQIWYFNRQNYNYFLFLRPRFNASFCSELVAKAYEEIGVTISLKRPSSTLPVDIYEFIQKNSDWENETNIYTEFFLGPDHTPSDDLYSVLALRIEEGNQDMAHGQQLLIDRIEAIQKSPAHFEPSRKYWNVPRRHRKKD